jgi:hypothetical protein
MSKRTKVTLIAGTVVLALAGIGGGVAVASAGPPATPTAVATTATSPQHVRRWASRVTHGEFTVRTRQGDRVVDVQRGRVTAVSATSVTVRSADGFTSSYAVSATSTIRDRKQRTGIGTVRTGDHVAVFATRSGGTATVRRLNDTTRH